MILMIDNYDSFTYNLVQLIGAFCPEIRVIRNDVMTVPEIQELNPSHIVLSPGPGYPRDAGVCKDVIRILGGKFPILGVCLGHQAICEVFGAQITHAVKLMHGKKSDIFIDVNSPLFKGLPEKIEAARYHSLIAKRGTVAEGLKVIAQDGMGEIMAVAHLDYPVFGLQFHPESVLTPCGGTIIKNFLEIGGPSNDQGSH